MDLREKRRYGVECFQSATPDDPYGYGDATDYYDDLEQADAWIRAALKQTRFNYFALYDQADGYWKFLRAYEREQKPRSLGPSVVFGKQALKTAKSLSRDRYSPRDVEKLKILLSRKRSVLQVASALKRTPQAIRRKALALGLRLPK